MAENSELTVEISEAALENIKLEAARQSSTGGLVDVEDVVHETLEDEVTE